MSIILSHEMCIIFRGLDCHCWSAGSCQFWSRSEFGLLTFFSLHTLSFWLLCVKSVLHIFFFFPCFSLWRCDWRAGCHGCCHSDHHCCCCCCHLEAQARHKTTPHQTRKAHLFAQHFIDMSQKYFEISFEFVFPGKNHKSLKLPLLTQVHLKHCHRIHTQPSQITWFLQITQLDLLTPDMKK